MVGNRVLPPEAGDEYKADYDIELWGWAGNPDPSALLDIFRCEQIGNTSDSQYCNPEYDKLYALQLTQAGEERAKTLAEMQNLIYDEAPYDILYYDANTGRVPQRPLRRLAEHARGRRPAVHLRHRSSTRCSPTRRRSRAPRRQPTSQAPASGHPPASSPLGHRRPPRRTVGPRRSDGGSNTALILVAVIAVVAVVIVGVILSRRQKGAPVDDE